LYVGIPESISPGTVYHEKYFVSVGVIMLVLASFFSYFTFSD